MSEKFFEGLKGKCLHNLHSEEFAARYRAEVREYGADRSDVLVHLTIDATIEALKEMMVGEPLECEIEHRMEKEYYDDPCPATDLYWGDGSIAWHEGHLGTDGEEVIVMVFRDDGSA